MSAAKRSNEYWPSRVSHPGETLADCLADRGWTQAYLCKLIRRPRKTICEIVKGKASITATTALQLERALKVPAQFWLARQAAYDLAVARRKR